MIDANLHLIKIKDRGYNSPDYILKNIKNIIKSKDLKEINELIKVLSNKITNKGFSQGLVYVFDEEWFENNWYSIKFPDNLIPGVLFDPLSEGIDKKLNILKENNINFLKILPYEQHIFKNNYDNVLYLAKKMEKRDMILTVCCAYGSRYLHKTNGVELVSYLVNNGIESPIIMAHGGMVKVFDAMSLMLEFPNLYMDISFTLPYWWGSSVIRDYAFTFEKLKYERIFYGSDYPYINFKKSMKYFNKFCKKYNIDEKAVDKILYDNFKNLLKFNF